MMKLRAYQDLRLGGDIAIQAYDVGMSQGRGTGHISVPSITWDFHAEGDIVEPAFLLLNTEAQALMDSLWDCGIRPTEGHGSAGSLAATERHLEDMRSLVFCEEPKPKLVSSSL